MCHSSLLYPPAAATPQKKRAHPGFPGKVVSTDTLNEPEAQARDLNQPEAQARDLDQPEAQARDLNQPEAQARDILRAARASARWITGSRTSRLASS